MNRNITTIREATEIRASIAKGGKPKLGPDDVTMDHEGIATEVKPDRWHESLTKAIPAEALSLYIALSAIVVGEEAAGPEGPWFLSCIVAACVVFNVIFLKRVWKVQRAAQVLLSCAALLVYVYASGGRLVEALPFHHPRVGSLLLITMAAFLALFPIYGGASGKQAQVTAGAPAQ